MKPGLLLSVLLLGSACASCEKAPAPRPAASEGQAGLSFRGFEASASHEGRLVWEARAVKARVWQDKGRALADEVDLTYYQDGQPVSWARADSAEMDLKGYGVKARGKVVVRGANGVVLSTSELDWDNKRQLATSSASVRVVRGGAVLTGVGLRADRRLDDVRILREVQAEASSARDLREQGQELRR